VTGLVAEVVFRNERHDLDRTYSVLPRDHPDNPTPGETYRRTLREELERRAYGYRADVILVNAVEQHCETCTCVNHGHLRESMFHQFAIEVSRSGELNGPREAFDLISADDLAWAKAEAARMVATGRESEAYAKAFLR
jgi:hypothetical protein